MKNIELDFNVTLPHHEYEVMDVDICFRDGQPRVGVSMNIGPRTRMLFTLSELRELVALGMKFGSAHEALMGDAGND